MAVGFAGMIDVSCNSTFDMTVDNFRRIIIQKVMIFSSFVNRIHAVHTSHRTNNFARNKIINIPLYSTINVPGSTSTEVVIPNPRPGNLRLNSNYRRNQDIIVLLWLLLEASITAFITCST
jgi:hypothetical protein